MKRCPNPNCDPSFLYGDDKVTCPFCHSRLIDSAAAPAGPGIRIQAPDRVSIRDEQRGEEEQREGFIRERNGTMECHGRVSEIDHHELFSSKRHKLFNSLLRGEPYQLSHQTVEYTIRVESHAEGVQAEVTDFCLFGNYLGRLQVGDSVIIRARNLNDRRVVRSIFNETTNSEVKPGLQLPAAVIRGVLLAVAAMLVAVMCSVVWLVESRSGAALEIKAFILWVIVIIAALWFIIRSVFPRRRRR